MDVSSPDAASTARQADDPARRARKRASWGQVAPGEDPLRILPASVSASETSAPTTTPTPSSSKPLLLDDPFWTGPPSRADLAIAPTAYPNHPGPSRMARFASSQSAASAVSLISRDTDPGSVRSDDEAELTQNMSWASPTPDPERSRRTHRYSAAPLAKSGPTLQSLSRNMRRISVRVVNFAGRGVEDHVRLDEQDYDDDEKAALGDDSFEQVPSSSASARRAEEAASAPAFRPLRGRTLGFLSSTNPVRLAMYRMLVSPYVPLFFSDIFSVLISR
jgi:hypothetical protein